MKDRFGVDAIQFYDHNFFDREVDMVPLLEVLAKFRMPWWCFARSDALVNLSERPGRWSRRAGCAWPTSARNRPATGCCTISARAPARDQTLEAVEKCRSHGVIPELSFMVAPPQDPEGETEKTFEFIRMIKRVHPATEVMIYIYTPLPRRQDAKNRRSGSMASEYRDCDGRPVVFPRTADEWAEPQWVDYWCHQDAPWLSASACGSESSISRPCWDAGIRPSWTSAPPPGESPLCARWPRGAIDFNDMIDPWELRVSRKLIRHWDPRVMSL